MRPSLALLIMLAACSNSGSKTPDAANGPDAATNPDAAGNPDAVTLPDAAANRDAAIPPDAAGPTVMTVTCPAGTLPTITTIDSVNAYMPSSVTIGVDGIVKFTTSSKHDVAPNSAMSDPGLVVGFNVTRCLKFSRAGTFGFHCSLHGFTGTVVVQ